MTRPDGTVAPAHLDLLFAGPVFCDLVFAGMTMPQPGAEVFAEGFTLTAGGVATRAVTSARLGVRTALLSQLGDDPLGRHLEAVLAAEPSSTSGGWRADPAGRRR